MKKILVVMVMAMALMWGAGVKGASAGYMSSVNFYALDDITEPINGDGSVTITASTVTFTANGIVAAALTDMKLKYKYGLTLWLDAGSEFAVSTPLGGMTQVYLALFDLNDNLLTTAGVLDLMGDEFGTGEYNGYSVVWDNNVTMTFGVASDDDNLSAVPIPAAVWLLGSGLLGLVGIRRRKKV